MPEEQVFEVLSLLEAKEPLDMPLREILPPRRLPKGQRPSPGSQSAATGPVAEDPASSVV
jgi:hypothetical protein